MWQKVVKVLGGDPNKREVERLSEIVRQINGLESSFEKLTSDELRSKTAEFRKRLDEGATLDDILPEAFAAVREASKRTIGLRHYDVQLIGGMVLHGGKIAEMRTGEGKTLVATLPLYLNAVPGRGVHLVTVNDYLARRDARWMAPIYDALGLTVGVLQMAARTENGRKAFVVDLNKTSPQEDQNQLKLVLRAEAYKADITYGTNSEYGFDYLRDNLTMTLEERVQRDHSFAIVDEVDNILIDEARTPLIISGPASEDTEWYLRMSQIVRQLNPEDYEINEKDRAVSLTELGEVHVEELLDIPLRDPERPEDITPEQARLLGYLEQSLRAQHLYKRNKDYLVQAGKVVIVDEFTGRLMPGRRWSEGLHQAVEAKEGVKVEPENVTYATITLQNYFRMYAKLAGMTGTASTESEEFSKIYKLEVVTIPMNLEYVAMQANAELAPVEKKDVNGYKYSYYARKDQPEMPVFWKRQDFPDVVYRSEEAKLRAITTEIIRFNVIGRPQLVGTTSVEHSERLSRRLAAEPLRRLLQIMLVRQAYLEKNNLDLIEKSSPELQVLNKGIDDLDVAELRPLARSLNVSLNLEDPGNVSKLLTILNLAGEDAPRLLKNIQAGIQHQVLNARKHDEESQIIAGAGAFGALTIATNMAGRGVDIKLGGELTESILQDTNRVLSRFHADPYDFNNDERRKTILALPPEEYGIYEEAIKGFLEYTDNMEKVRTLGGLHVIGSERHEARRIDNQLRGRAARQGDPGSSRFYLSLEDELMRLFGGPQVENLWKRIFFDESLPLEMNLLGRMVEQSQERVEGANFDVRKHLLEYDDVLNSQRKRIYSQRDMVFSKEDLTEDVLDMLRSEMQRRIPTSLKDEEGPWKLLAYLDEIQPAFSYQSISMPSFTIRLLHEDIRQMEKDTGSLHTAMLNIAEKALLAEKAHLMRAAQRLLDQALDSLQTQREERNDALDIFLEGLQGQKEEGLTLKPQDIQLQLNEAMRMSVKLLPDQLRRLGDGDKDVIEDIRDQIQQYLTSVAVNRAISALERRLEDSLGIRSLQAGDGGWRELANQILDSVDTVFTNKMGRLLGDKGQIAADLYPALEKLDSSARDDSSLTPLLVLMAQGTRLTFDSRTHKKGSKTYTRINYVYMMASIIEGSESEEITARILAHMEEALTVLQKARGVAEFDRLAANEITFRNVHSAVQDKIISAIGEDQYITIVDVPAGSLGVNIRTLAQEVIGSHLQNEAYRELLLRVISEQWVEYLTQVEALRVSIGMEAYAQRDPLVQYKGRASELFASLLTDIRMGVVSRVFTYHPRQGVVANIQVEREKAEEAAAPVLPLPQSARSTPVQVTRELQPSVRSPHPAGTPPAQQQGGDKKKRKRH